MYLFKRGSRYHLSFTVDEGKEVRVSTGCRTKVEATAFLLKFKADRHQQKLRRDQKTFSDFIKEFERHSQCQHSPKTTSSYRTAMEEFQRAMGDRQLKEYGIRDVEDFILKKRGDLSLHSVRSYHTHLSAAFEVARKWGYIEDNPFRKVKRVKPPQSTPVFVTKDQFQTLLQLCDDQDLKDVLLTAVMTGMRLGELMAIRWEDVDLATQTILVRSREDFTTKNRKNRVIPINNALLTVLERRHGLSTGRVFESRGRRFVAETVSKGFKHLAKVVGLDAKVHFHSLRHSFASWLVQGGVSLYEVQKLLGHSSLLVTQIYAHLQPETLHNTVNKIQLNLN
jgi:integrase